MPSVLPLKYRRKSLSISPALASPQHVDLDSPIASSPATASSPLPYTPYLSTSPPTRDFYCPRIRRSPSYSYAYGYDEPVPAKARDFDFWTTDVAKQTSAVDMQVDDPSSSDVDEHDGDDDDEQPPPSTQKEFYLSFRPRETYFSTSAERGRWMDDPRALRNLSRHSVFSAHSASPPEIKHEHEREHSSRREAWRGQRPNPLDLGLMKKASTTSAPPRERAKSLSYFCESPFSAAYSHPPETPMDELHPSPIDCHPSKNEDSASPYPKVQEEALAGDNMRTDRDAEFSGALLISPQPPPAEDKTASSDLADDAGEMSTELRTGDENAQKGAQCLERDVKMALDGPAVVDEAASVSPPQAQNGDGEDGAEPPEVASTTTPNHVNAGSSEMILELCRSQDQVSEEDEGMRVLVPAKDQGATRAEMSGKRRERKAEDTEGSRAERERRVVGSTAAPRTDGHAYKKARLVPRVPCSDENRRSDGDGEVKRLRGVVSANGTGVGTGTRAGKPTLTVETTNIARRAKDDQKVKMKRSADSLKACGPPQAQAPVVAADPLKSRPRSTPSPTPASPSSSPALPLQPAAPEAAQTHPDPDPTSTTPVPASAEYAEMHGLLIESFATARASSLPVSGLHRAVMQSRPALAKRRSAEAWKALIRDVLESGCAPTGSGVFAKVGRGKDTGDARLEAQWFYVPERDEDQERAALIQSMMPKPEKRAETKKHKQYYWKPLVKVSRWDSEDVI